MSRKLSREEAIAYLANVLSIAQATDGTSTCESLILKDIQARIGSDHHDLRGAHALLAEPDFKLRLIMLPEMRMSNLEDMVMMALVDNKIDTNEAEPIEKMANALNYTQVDVNMLVRRAQGKLQKLVASSTKNTRPTEKQKTSSRKQPPPVPAETKQKPPPPPPAKTAPPPAKTAPPPKPAPPKPEPTKPAPVSDPAPVKKPSNAIDTCKQARDATANPAEYCFGYGSGEINIWGCRLVGMNWTAGADWFRKGHFRDNSTFVFDKNELVNRVTKNFLKCKDCPYINIDYIETAFDLLPSRASIIGRWTHHKAERHSPHAQELAVKRTIHGCETSEQILTDGVDPVGIRGALKIIKQSTRKTQSIPPDYKLLAAESG